MRYLLLSLSLLSLIQAKPLTLLNATPKHSFPEKPFPFVNAKAPKGGTLRLSNQGTFDSLNRFSIHGTVPEEMLMLQYETLMIRSPDEAFTLYPLVAQSAEIASDNSSVTFSLNPKAKFFDGTSVESPDIQATIEHLRDKGKPRYKSFYSKLKSVECLDKLRIKLTFNPLDDGSYDPEAPLLMAQSIPVLSKKSLEETDIGEQSNTAIEGTGPYKVHKFELGQSIEMERRKDYWAKDYLKGFYNFDIVRVDYYKTTQSQFQAFQAKNFDVYFETNPQNWNRGYDFPAVREDKVKRLEAEHKKGVLARYIAINMRRPVFQDVELRRALSLVFDADGVNRLVYEGGMKIPQSTFSNTIYAPEGKAEGKELQILTKYKCDIGARFDEIVNAPFKTTHTKTQGDLRAHIQKADAVLKKAGYLMKDGVRLDKQGKPLTFSIMIKDEKLEKIALIYLQSLKNLGIALKVERIDTVQYENRVLEFNWDMLIHAIANGMSPGAEQSYFYGAKFADVPGASNYIGLKDPVLEKLTGEITKAKDKETHIAACRAMDRYLMHLYCLFPIMYDNKYRDARWVDKFEVPPYDANSGVNVVAYGWTK